MLHGLLMELDDRNCRPSPRRPGIAGRTGCSTCCPAVWDDQQVLDIASAWAVGHPGDGDAVLIVDENGR
jgi:hypothetical protein